MNKFISICLASVVGVTTLVGGSVALIKNREINNAFHKAQIEDNNSNSKFVVATTSINNQNANNTQNECIDGNCYNNATTYDNVYSNINNNNNGYNYNNGYNNGYNNNFGTYNNRYSNIDTYKRPLSKPANSNIDTYKNSTNSNINNTNNENASTVNKSMTKTISGNTTTKDTIKEYNNGKLSEKITTTNTDDNNNSTNNQNNTYTTNSNTIVSNQIDKDTKYNNSTNSHTDINGTNSSNENTSKNSDNFNLYYNTNNGEYSGIFDINGNNQIAYIAFQIKELVDDTNNTNTYMTTNQELKSATSKVMQLLNNKDLKKIQLNETQKTNLQNEANKLYEISQSLFNMNHNELSNYGLRLETNFYNNFDKSFAQIFDTYSERTSLLRQAIDIINNVTNILNNTNYTNNDNTTNTYVAPTKDTNTTKEYTQKDYKNRPYTTTYLGNDLRMPKTNTKTTAIKNTSKDVTKLNIDNGQLPLDKQVDETINKAKNTNEINKDTKTTNSESTISHSTLKKAEENSMKIKNSNFPNTNPTLNNNIN